MFLRDSLSADFTVSLINHIGCNRAESTQSNYRTRWSTLYIKARRDNISHLQEVDGVELVFVSSDQSAEAMVAYMKESHGDWWAVEFGSDAVKALKSHFGVSGIPMLVVLNKDGKLVTKEGRDHVSGKGPASIAEWKKA